MVVTTGEALLSIALCILGLAIFYVLALLILFMRERRMAISKMPDTDFRQNPSMQATNRDEPEVPPRQERNGRSRSWGGIPSVHPREDLAQPIAASLRMSTTNGIVILGIRASGGRYPLLLNVASLLTVTAAMTSLALTLLGVDATPKLVLWSGLGLVILGVVGRYWGTDDRGVDAARMRNR
jgi:hypothetical protein